MENCDVLKKKTVKNGWKHDLDCNGTKSLQTETASRIPKNNHSPNKTDVSTHIKIASSLLYVVLKLETILFIPWYIYSAFRKEKKVPPIDDGILRLSVRELTEKIRMQEVKCEDAIRCYIDRINKVNPIINAVIDNRFELALQDAKNVDEMVERLKNEDKEKWNALGEEFPLLGVPLTIKGSLDVQELRNTSGVVTRTEICQKDAVAVEYARKAGAIPLLTSNVPELCMNWETSNNVIGTTNNPHNILRTSGGSSGGECSLLAAGASLIGIGSDIAGSLRLPAHFCGVFGHKPTPNAVSVEGHYPSCQNLERWNEVFAVGPMARYTSDLKLLLKVICKEEHKSQLKLDQNVNLKNLKIFYIEDLNSLLTDKVNNNCSESLQEAVKHMESACETFAQKLELPLLKHAPVLASLYLLHVEGIDSLFEGERCEGSISEFLKYLTCRSKHTMMAILYGLLKKVVHSNITKEKRKEVDDCIHEIKSSLMNTVEQNGVILMPCFPNEAHTHKEVFRKPFNSGFLSLFNAIGFPVTSCPVGRTKEGLPVGIQIAALPFNDNLTLEVARELEKKFGGWYPPQ